MISPKSTKDGRSGRRLPRLDWYPQDYLADRRVVVMTLEQKGAYTDLLWHEWLDGPLPTDHRELARLLGVTPAVFRRVWRRVGECFTETPAGLVSPRLERERERALSERDAKATAGAARWKGMSKAERAAAARAAAEARWGSEGASGASTDMRADVPAEMHAGSEHDATPPAANRQPPEEEPPKGPPEGGGSADPPPKKPRSRKSVTPEERLARDLNAALGAKSLGRCRETVKALLQHGRTLDELRTGLGLALPGDAPWDWAKKVRDGPTMGLGPSTTGRREVTPADTLAWADRLEAEERKRAGGAS